MLNYIVHILIDFTYCMPDFVLTIMILTLSCLPLLNSGLKQELSTFSCAVYCMLCLLERIGDFNSETLNVIVNTNFRNSDLIASIMVCFDRFHHCSSFRTVVLFRLYLCTKEPMYL